MTCADGDGRVHGAAAESLPPPTSPRPGWREHDARSWWPAAVSALRRLTDALGPRRRAVRAVAVAATSGTVLVADAHGRPLAPALLYDDRRAAAEAERAQQLGEERWAALGLRIGSSFGLPKLAWLLNHADAGNRGHARHAWHASDLLVHRLSGEAPPTDWSHALKTGYDVLRGEWPEDVLESLGVDPALLPTVLPPGVRAGRVTPAAAAETGLPRGCDIRLGMTDATAAQLAAGADRPGRWAGVLGTTLAIKGASDMLARDPSGAVYSHRHPEGWWLPGGASSSGGRALVEVFGDADLGALDLAAARRGPSTCLAYPLAGTGERFPFVAPDARGLLLGAPEDAVDRYRAILEGVAFAERLGYARLSSLGLRMDTPLHVGGGGSRSRVWNAIRATVLGDAVARTRHPDTAFGACLLAAAGVLHRGAAEAAGAMVSVAEVVEPVAAEREALDRAFRRLVSELAARGWISEPLVDAATAPGPLQGKPDGGPGRTRPASDPGTR